MIESKIRNLTGQASRSSIFLSRSLLESNRVERNLEKKSLILKRKIVEERGRTLRNLASTNRETQKGGVLGGALGLLGLGGGGGLLRRGLRRTPSSPNQLLRMQRGTSNLSRVGRVGRLARPLAVVGTGLDFIGRRAEGQTNLQAGVGAGGGLAGSLAGAKIGATLGTAAGPIGTLVGGAGGAIIGGLVGGNFADLFTGANRRREFEEQRAILRSQKTLFSEALDDFDDVLDKFEDIAIGLAIGRRGDTDEQGRRKRPFLPIIPSVGARILKFLRRPEVQATGVTLLAAGLITAAVLTRGKSVPASQKVIEKVLTKSPFLRKLSEKEQIAAVGKIIERSLPKSAQQRIRMETSPFLDKLGRFTPGKKGAPGRIPKDIVRKRNQARREKFLQKKEKAEKEKLNKALDKASKLDKDVEKQLSGIEGDLKILGEALRTGELPENVSRESFRRVLKSFQDVMADMLQSGGMSKGDLDQILRNLKRIDRGKEIFKNERKSKPLEMEQLLKRIQEIIGETPKPLSSLPKDQRLDPLDTTGSSNIAQALGGDIFLLGGETNRNQQQPPTIINEGSNLAMTPSSTSPYRAVAQNIMFESLLTA